MDAVQYDERSVTLQDKVGAVQGLTTHEYVITRNLCVRAAVSAYLEFTKLARPEARHRAALGARFERRCWRRMRAGMTPVRLGYTDGRESYADGRERS